MKLFSLFICAICIFVCLSVSGQKMKAIGKIFEKAMKHFKNNPSKKAHDNLNKNPAKSSDHIPSKKAQDNLNKSPAKSSDHVPTRKEGPSGKPMQHFKNYSNKKTAENAAKNASKGD